MNSVISAFKAKKNPNSNTNNDKHNGGSSILMNSSKKKALNSQENGYQHLRHLREIETARKLSSPVVVPDDMLETEKLSFRPVPCMDVVDHVPLRLTHTLEAPLSLADCNMNNGMEGKCLASHPVKACNGLYSLENGNCNENASASANGGEDNYNCSSPVASTAEGLPSSALASNNGCLDLDDDESENSTTACTSSSSDQSNSTVVLHSPTKSKSPTSSSTPDESSSHHLSNSKHSSLQTKAETRPRPQSPSSPTKSLSPSLNSNASSATVESATSSNSTGTLATISSLVISSSSSLKNVCDKTTASSNLSSPSPSLSPSPPPTSPTTLIKTNGKDLSDEKSQRNDENVPAFLKSAPKTLPIIMPNGNSSLVSVPPLHPGTTSINSASNTPKHRYSKPRLSLSRFINHSMPSVHGRPNLSLANGNGDNTNCAPSTIVNPPKRISTHQRNLSLDFRSMGILLPPVSQVTNVRINLTQHHRNRSLDSALQRIPEVEVSSPNAESENTFCTPSILSSTMCSKIVTTAASVTAALTTTTTPALTLTNNPVEVLDKISGIEQTAAILNADSSSSLSTSSSSPSSGNKDNGAIVVVSKSLNSNCSSVTTKAPTPSQHLQNSNDLCGSVRCRPRTHDHPPHGSLTSEKIISPGLGCNPLNNIGAINGSCSSNNPSNSITGIVTGNGKKREDLTSLGSDDSGIICGSDSDQLSLNRIRHSHESLDSGEMDAEEECIDMLETTSMDEEYNLLQSDLCFYSSAEIDCRTLRPRKKHPKDHQQQSHTQLQSSSESNETSINIIDQDVTDSSKTFIDDCSSSMERKRYREMNMSQAAINMEKSRNSPTPTLSSAPDTPTASLDTTNDPSTPTMTPVPTPTSAINPLTISQIPAAGAAAGSTSQGTTSNTNVSTTSTASSTSSGGKAQNDILFRNFFGATKNAIFRTAQSIIENHEKKNAAKNQKSEDQASNAGDHVKSPTDISKKKEFFSFTSHSSKKAAAAAAAAAAASQNNQQNQTTPTNIMQNSSSNDSTDLKSPSLSEKTLNGTESFDKSGGISASSSSILPISLLSSNATTTTATNQATEVAAATEESKNLQTPHGGNNIIASMSKSASISSLNKLKVPGVVKCFIKERSSNAVDAAQQKTEKGPSGLLRFFESPVFNIHFAVHYLFYSKEPGVLSFIGNKIFSFPDQEVDLYIPQLIVMYIQMDELAEVLDPYLTIRCRKSVDFALKCLWLLEAYNYQVDSLGNTGRKTNLALMKELFSKKERKIAGKSDEKETKLSPTGVGGLAISPIVRKTHHRSQSDATVLLTDSRGGGALSISNRSYQQPPYTTQTLPITPAKLCLGDLTSGRAFENGCTCFETVRGQVNGLLGQKTVCSCGAPKTAPQKEFMKALINVGKNLTSLPSKAEKTSALRMFLNLINKNLPARVWIPLYSDIPHHVVRITEEKTAVLNSKDKTPYIIYVEVVEVPDIYSSPLIPKMMPSLRHTKSEEHLDGACVGPIPHITCSRTSSCSSRGGNNINGCSNGSSCRRKKEKLISESSSIASDLQNHQNHHHNCHSMCGGGTSDFSCSPCSNNHLGSVTLGGLHLTEDDVWSQEDDEITAQYLNLRKVSERDAISQMSLDSCDSRDQGMPVLFNIGDVRTRHCNNLNCENTKSFSNDPEDPSAAALKEPWHEKEKQIKESSPYGHLSNWRLLSAIVKCGDDLRQELMATQLLQMFKIIWQEEKVDLWVRPYKIICLSNDSGLIEPILNTVSLHQIKKNSNKSLRDYFIDEYGPSDGIGFRLAQKNFVQSCAAYCLISYLLQVKDRHNGNILLHSDGHIIHIDFGFILSISPKNLGFEQSPFKLTHEFVDVMGGTQSEHWREFNRLLLVGMMSARKHMDRIINFVEIMRSNVQLPCFKNGCSGTVQNLRKRFHMNLTEQEMERKVEQLVQDSVKSLSTKLYDGYQYYTNGIL